MKVGRFWDRVERLVETHKRGDLVPTQTVEQQVEQQRESVAGFLTDIDLLASAWYNEGE